MGIPFLRMQTEDNLYKDSNIKIVQIQNYLTSKITEHFSSVLPSPEPPEYPIGAAFFPLTSMISIKVKCFLIIIKSARDYA